MVTEDVAGRRRVQHEEFGIVKYVEIAKNKRSLRIAQVGHYKIQKQNVKKIFINYQQWRIQSRIAKT
jgi:hypothetical protein